jgi:hypothetical protein
MRSHDGFTGTTLDLPLLWLYTKFKRSKRLKSAMDLEDILQILKHCAIFSEKALIEKK